MTDFIKKIKKMSMAELCATLLGFIKDDAVIYKERVDDIYSICYAIESFKVLRVEEVAAFLDLHRALHGIKNTKARLAEKHTVRKIANMPIDYLHLGYERPDLKKAEAEQVKMDMNKQLLTFAAEILKSKEGKTQREKHRLRMILELLVRMHLFYRIKGVEKVFFKYLGHKEEAIRSVAFEGLEAHVEHGGEFNEEEIEMLEQLIATSTEYLVVVTCCDLLVKTEKMDEIEAVGNVDAWRARANG